MRQGVGVLETEPGKRTGARELDGRTDGTDMGYGNGWMDGLLLDDLIRGKRGGTRGFCSL